MLWSHLCKPVARFRLLKNQQIIWCSCESPIEINEWCSTGGVTAKQSLWHPRRLDETSLFGTRKHPRRLDEIRWRREKSNVSSRGFCRAAVVSLCLVVLLYQQELLPSWRKNWKQCDKIANDREIIKQGHLHDDQPQAVVVLLLCM